MSSILKKAIWPATLIAGMLLLIGAVGTATAPTAQAAPGDLCLIAGPFPALEEDSIDLLGHGIDGKLLIGETYLFIIYVEDGDDVTGDINVEIDDEEGDADLTSYADGNGDGTSTYIELTNGVDVLPGLPHFDAGDWESGDPNFITDLEIEFGFSLDEEVCGDDVEPTDESFVIVDVTCEDPGRFEMTAYEQVGPDNSITGEYLCVANANASTLTAVPLTVESVPAPGNVSHSLLVLVLTDAEGNPAAPGQDVDWTTDRCRIDGLDEDEYEDDAPGFYSLGAGALFASYSGSVLSAATIESTLSGHGGLTGASNSLSFENDANPGPLFTMRTIAVAILHCEGAAPGVANIAAELERPGADLRATATVTVVGPPAFITMTAAPSKLVCGEKATILVTVTDAINQKVSDHTRVELITNYGGVLGGTGATLAFPGVQPVSPLSSGAAETFGGVATAYLLTSSAHVGAYEVVAAAGGSFLGTYTVVIPAAVGEQREDVIYVGYGGVFSTPVVTSQVTVTCTAGAPVVTAPNTGTGTISPPNTGDAGLVSASNSSASLFVMLGAVAFVVAGLASFGYARR